MNINNKSPLSQAQLWLGPHEHLCKQVEQLLQKQFCPHNGCQACTTCRLIQEHQYHGAIWLYPEKRYTIDQIQIIFETIHFLLVQEQKLFFIIQKADFLTAACSNSLLKSVEEPPTGYYFIFLAERKDLILPTIRSRCIIQSFQAEKTTHKKEELLSYFITDTKSDPIQFIQTLEKIQPTEQESLELLDVLFIHWMNKTKMAASEKKHEQLKQTEHTLDIIKKALLRPPMPGSSFIFWKNLFLHIKRKKAYSRHWQS